MSLLSNAMAIPPASTGYNLTNSLRFRESASAYLNRTPSSTGNRKTWTWSAWIKRGKLGVGSNQFLFDSTWAASTSGWLSMRISTDDTLYMDTYSLVMNTSAKLRDPSAWYHVIYVIDTTEATASDRVKIYLNGTQLTVTGSFPALNSDTAINSTNPHAIGRYNWGGLVQLDGYLTEINFVDGQALAPTDFGEYDDTTGVWKPKEYTGTYGTNGFYLENGRGTDQSGNGNNWTENNFNTTTSTATTYDIMSDVPTLTDEDTGNFATMSPLTVSNTTQPTFAEANLKVTCNMSSGSSYAYSSIKIVAGQKIYVEAKAVSGISSTSGEHGTFGVTTQLDNYTSTNVAVYHADGRIFTDAGGSSSFSTGYSSGDLVAAAIDFDNKAIELFVNGSSHGTANWTGDYDAIYVSVSANGGVAGNRVWAVNFGQRPFDYTPPTGYKKLNTYNLPDSAVKNGREYFDTAIWNGNNTARTIDNTITDASGTETGDPILFSPDLVWVKGRSNATYHMITDSVRGATKYLYSNDTLAEGTWTDQVTSFNTSGVGFNLGVDTNSTVNYAGRTFAGWIWRGSDSTAVSNSIGSITSTVSANTTSGCSIVTYTGNGTSGATVGHGIGIKPGVIFVKSRDSGGGAADWVVYHSALGATKNVRLHSTAVVQTQTVMFNDTEPTSTFFTLGNNNNVNYSGTTMVAYCFAEVEGFSKFGSYTGNGSTDGPFIYLGFRPAFILSKRTDSTTGGEWHIQDTTRTEYNWYCRNIMPHSSAAENTSELESTYGRDYLSNGYKIRASHNSHNASGGTYIYMAFASNPLKHSLAR